MKLTVFIFFVLTIFSCGKKVENDKINDILKSMEKQVNAESSTMLERDENIREQGFKRVLNIDFINCKNIDMMDRSLKQTTRNFTQELKNNIPGSERIDLYKIRLLKDPNDKTPNSLGFNITEKGFSYNREDLE